MDLSPLHHPLLANILFLFYKMPIGEQSPHWYFHQSKGLSFIWHMEFRTMLGLRWSDKRSMRLWSFPQKDAFWTRRAFTKVFVNLQHLAAQVSGGGFQVLRCLHDASSETGHSDEKQGCQIYTFHTTQCFLEVWCPPPVK